MARSLVLLLDRAALGATLLCPLFLLHGRGIAEGLIAVTGFCFLARSAVAGDWGWLRTGWVRIALGWWAWLVVCSTPPIGEGGWPTLVQALASVRMPLFAAALEHAVLRQPRWRLLLLRLVQAATLYIAVQAAVQFATGHNLFGDPRGADGELTGPFDKPRAAAPFSRMIFPALLPVCAGLMARPGWAGRTTAAALALAGIAVLVLFGQRMPVLLGGLGLVVSALLLPRLRALVLGTALAGVVLVGATAVVSPQAHHRLVEKFSAQMEHFGASDYGHIFHRALEIAGQHPLTGRGWDGFRTGCALPRYFTPGDGGAAFCVQHPHNHYLQALVDGGVPGLALFCALVGAWLVRLWRGIGGRGIGGRGFGGRGIGAPPDPLRAGLFVAVLLQEWPIASSNAFTNMPLGGWFFLLLGLGLAEARAVVAAGRASYMVRDHREAGAEPHVGDRRQPV